MHEQIATCIQTKGSLHGYPVAPFASKQWVCVTVSTLSESYLSTKMFPKQNVDRMDYCKLQSQVCVQIICVCFDSSASVVYLSHFFVINITDSGLSAVLVARATILSAFSSCYQYL